MLVAGAAQVHAPNLENLNHTEMSGINPSMSPVSQDDKNAAALRENLSKLPPAFKIDLSACSSNASFTVSNRDRPLSQRVESAVDGPLFGVITNRRLLAGNVSS